MCTPISFTSWWITSSSVSFGCSIIGVGLLAWIGRLIFNLSACRSAFSNKSNAHFLITILRKYTAVLNLYDDILHRIRCTIVHTNVAGKRFAQINVAEALRQQHKLAGSQWLGATHGRYVFLQDLRKQCADDIFGLGSDHLRIDQGGPGQSHYWMRGNSWDIYG